MLHGFSAIALVTGRGTGVGKAITGALALNGCDVYITACKEALLKETTAEFNKAGAGKVEYIIANMTSAKPTSHSGPRYIFGNAYNIRTGNMPMYILVGEQ